MWLVLAFLSAALLGFYDSFKKKFDVKRKSVIFANKLCFMTHAAYKRMK